MVPKRSIVLRAACLALIVVSALTLLVFVTESSVFIVLLYPGTIPAFFIAGGHGGKTVAQDWLALGASVLVNTISYTVVFASILWIRRRVAEKRRGEKEEERRE
jgi:hypothetical protein